MDTLASKGSKVNVKPGAVVEFVKTTLSGEVHIGKGTVVHPTVQILAEGGPIFIGENNLIEEGTVILNRRRADGVERPIIIGNDNVFEVRSRSEASAIGNNNVIQMTAVLAGDVTIGNGCVIGVGVHIAGTAIPDKKQIYIQDGMIQQRLANTYPQAQTQQLEYLRNVIPNYHKIHKPKVDS